MAQTPAEWLPILAKRLDDRTPRVQLLKRYMDGDAPLPEAGADTREAWQRFQRQSRTNWGNLILEAVTDRIVPKGITVAGDPQSEVARQAQRIWRDNRMDAVFQEWLRYGLALRESYLTCWQGADGRAVVTADSPETMIVAADPLQSWRVRAAARFWRDIDTELDYALVWSQDGYQYFTRPARDDKAQIERMVQGKWNAQEYTQTGRPPSIVVYNNPGGVGEYETHTDLINRINEGILNRLVIVAMQAFRQRALERTDGNPLPKKDDDGNDINWGDIFSPAPAALWDLPPGVKIWESQTTDIGNLLTASKDDIRQLAAATRTPVPILMPDNTNTSAAGAISAETGYISKCGARLSQAKIGGEAILVKALEMEGVEGLADMNVSLEFEPVERVSTAEKYQAAQAAKAAGQSQKSIQRDILGWGPDEIQQDAIDRADEALRAIALMPTQANDRTNDNQ